MAGKKTDLGPIGVNVTHNVRHFRHEVRRLSYAELSRRLADLGREIPSLGLRRIESGERRVDVDDLVALALALQVSPLALLLTTERGPVLPNGKVYDPELIWDWATGQHPLLGTDDAISFMRYSDPLNWPESEAILMQLRGANESVQAGIVSNQKRNKAHRDRQQKLSSEVSRGDD